MNIPDIKILKPSQCREVVFKKNYPEFYKYLLDKYIGISFSEKLYWYYNGITEKPVCKNCGKPVKFINAILGYAQYCCKKCSNNSIEKIEKTKNACIERYGGVAPIFSDTIKTKITNTMIERYGVENCQQNESISLKTKQTIIDKYGGQGNASDRLKQKYVDTCIKRYGVDNSSKDPRIKEKISAGKRKSILTNNENIIDYFNEDDDTLMCICKCPHINCNKCVEKQYVIASSVLANRISHNIELCTKLLPYRSLTSSYEVYLCDLLNKYGIDYKCNVRNIISKELDIYIPSKNIAIEFNGVFYHSDERKPNNYHINKFNECKSHGIKLISIWEDQYINKIDIVRSIILSKLGIYDYRIYGRKCSVVSVDTTTANNFYLDNHLQGKCNANIHYALLHDNEMVAIMSFGKRSLSKDYNNNWELIRYCSRKHTNVIGGASKLFTHFVNAYNPTCIISWSSNDISSGDMYDKLGFEYVGMTSSYWYISKDMKRYHRANFNKAKLLNKGLILENDTRSEKEITHDLGLIRIFDSGQTKWIWYK